MHGVSTSTLRVLEPAEGVLAFYDGRVPGRRLVSPSWNWLDDAAYELGIASYALISDGEALVYDTSISLAHAGVIRRELEHRGARSIRVALSHHHRDHVAGTEVFADCPILSSRKTAQALAEKRDSYARSTPPISPLVMPTQVFDGTLTVQVGSMTAQLRPLDIHSFDGTALYLPQTRLLFAGDALEDCATYVAEPERLSRHLAELERLQTWDVDAVFPCHGDPDRIAAGGYATSLISATHSYVSRLLRCRQAPDLADLTLQAFAADSFRTGALIYHEAYDAVHRDNLRAVLEADTSA
ncbi:MBL fold metallo-hydrolase [Rhodobacteraceae bacterium M382]|nr:MBL fold metallo-hydrolase [Rhodobacteraceae bacterium M382]